MESVSKCRSTCSRIYLQSVQRSKSKNCQYKECHDDIISYSILPLLKLTSFTPCPTQRKTLHCFQQSRVFHLNTVSVDVLSVFNLSFDDVFTQMQRNVKSCLPRVQDQARGWGPGLFSPGETPPQGVPLSPQVPFSWFLIPWPHPRLRMWSSITFLLPKLSQSKDTSLQDWGTIIRPLSLIGSWKS